MIKCWLHSSLNSFHCTPSTFISQPSVLFLNPLCAVRSADICLSTGTGVAYNYYIFEETEMPCPHQSSISCQ